MDGADATRRQTVIGNYEKGKSRPPTSPTRPEGRHLRYRPITGPSDGKDDKSQEDFGAAPHERPVPRISIHAFCEFPDTGAALQRAGADRRLSKAHLKVQLGGINAAVEHYHGQVTPNLLIVETTPSAARRRWTNSTAWPKSAIPPPR